jgi:hypothetical protein
MARISSKLRSAEGGMIMFRCPGCDDAHAIRTGNGPGPRWTYDGNAEAPTFEPSVLVSGFIPSDKPEEFDDASRDQPFVCHSFVRAGTIQFLSDCTHALAGTTVDLPDFDRPATPTEE